jgi:hypothetical protein
MMFSEDVFPNSFPFSTVKVAPRKAHITPKIIPILCSNSTLNISSIQDTIISPSSNSTQSSFLRYTIGSSIDTNNVTVARQDKARYIGNLIE